MYIFPLLLHQPEHRPLDFADVPMANRATARMAKLVDAWDLKSPLVRACRFDSGFGHHLKSRVCERKLMQTLVRFRF